ncbi:semaphorin-4F isoform X2 [Hypomesus transpacificus]|uniref:semaphorin-4F isoform X2 n=1 Tax=Hypomesus transpacificus TaxID=137520 RepID=UPI001F078FF9|nr:semaphorin-4F isoform X2 [Hypomesus transpacificus]
MHRFIYISVIICMSSAVICLSESPSGEVIGVSNASVLLLHPPSNSLYLGARDSILVLDPSNLTHKGPVIEWKVSDKDKQDCMNKGKSEDECHNYICLLESLGDGSIYVCGSYAYNPQCAFIVDSTLRKGEGGDVEKEGKKGICPYEPGKPHTAVKADGILYSASSTNFRGTEFDVARVTGPEKKQLRIQSTWLTDPEFVSSAVLGAEPKQRDYIYWFLMENAREFDLYSPVRVARVARVCKHDLGGYKTLQGRWTTFLKTGLVCKEKGPGGRRYDVLIHLQPLEHQAGDPTSTHFYGLFTSQWGSELVSAVCVFSVAVVDEVMANSPFKDMKTSGNTATPTAIPSPRPGLCIGSDLRSQYNTSLQMPDQVLTFAKEHPQLTRPVEAVPLLVRRGVTYTRLAVCNVTSTQAAILYLGTDQGELHSVSVVGGTATLLQEIPVTTSVEPVNNILVHQGGVLVGSASSLRAVQVDGCRSFSSCEVCAAARGLDCGWNSTTRVCITQPPGFPEATGSPLNVCGRGEDAACEVQELHVRQGVRLLLPCTSLSLSPSPPCTWSHPPARHTRLLPSSHLEVVASPSSQGSYSCHCPARGATSLGSSACPTASYKLILISVEGRSEGLHSQAPVGVYLICLLVGALCGALVAVAVLKWRERSASQHILLVERDGRGTVETGQGSQNPICYANDVGMKDTAPGQ